VATTIFSTKLINITLKKGVIKMNTTSVISFETITLLLRISFYVGAVTDGLAVIPMVFPSIGSALFGGNSSRSNNAEYRFAMGIGASLMAGWTLLLIWGSLEPIGRRDILILTLIPVVLGIVISTMIAVNKQVISRNRVIPLWIHLGLVSILFVVSYALSFRISP
jgi:hypothetical protein